MMMVRDFHWKISLFGKECGTYYEIKRLDNEMGYAQKHVIPNIEKLFFIIFRLSIIKMDWIQ